MTTLGDLTEPNVDQSGPSPEGEFVYVDISSVDNRAKRIVEPKRLIASTAPSRARQRLRSGDVLVSMTRPNLNAVALVPSELDGAIGSTGFHVLRRREGVLSQWLYYGVQNRDFVGAMSELVQGALYPAVRPKDIRAFKLDAPPLEDQRRIVADIEKQFSRLDEAVANLKRIKVNLKRYKAAVLKAAVEGRIVANVMPQIGSAKDLLSSIQTRRRLDWEKSLGDVRGAKYRAPARPGHLPPVNVPNHWSWATLEELTPASRPCAYGILQPGDALRDGVRMVRVGDINEGRVDSTDLKVIDPAIAAAYPRTQLQGGEFLITLVGAIGRVAIVPNELQGANVARAVGVVPLTDQILPQWVSLWFQSPAVLSAMDRAAHEVARKTLNLEDVRRAPIALPPLDEQQRIIESAERQLSLISSCANEVEVASGRAMRLRDAVLTSAFSVS